MPPRQWVFDPSRGGVKIKEAVKCRTEERIHRCAELHFAGRFTRLDIRFRSKFCYVDAYTEPTPHPNWPPPDWHESREDYLERLRNTPKHLFRLRYFGDEQEWGFAFYSYAHERYEFSVSPSGEFVGTPEDAFLTSASVHL